MLTDMTNEEVAKECPTRKSFSNSDGRVSLKVRNPTMFAIKKQDYRMALARYMGITSKNANKSFSNSDGRVNLKVRNPTMFAIKKQDQVFAPDKQVEVVSDESNVPRLVVETDIPWIVHGIKIGYRRASSVLKTLPGLHELEESILEGRRIRQFAEGQFDDKGNDIGGFFVLSDVAAAVLFDNVKGAAQWANNEKNRMIVSSLTLIDSQHRNVSLP